jgi:molecular chaperone DnaK
MERGVPVIRKSDTLKDTVPSCVHFNRRKDVLAGDPAIAVMKNDHARAMKHFKPGETNTFIEFKRTMGTTATYHSNHMNRDFTSEELSAEILKKLKSFILDENISSIVITVPAKFLSPQCDATVRAAKMAGFKQVVLLQEPIAALTAYGLSAEKKDGFWLVFDFGGGTFDAALVKAEEGIMSIKDTDGDNWLGGKNLDEAIVDRIILPYLQKTYSIEGILNDPGSREILRNGVKQLAENAKIQMSFKDTHHILTELGDLPFEDEYGAEPEVDVAVTQKEMERVLSPVFQKAIDITKELLKRNNLRGADLDALILVGGPTHSPILRRMLREQITENVNTSVDPMTVVAQGAALYASTVTLKDEDDDKKTDKEKDKDTEKKRPPGAIRLSVNNESMTVETTELITIKVLDGKTEDGKDMKLPEEMFVDVCRSDGAWSSGMKRISDKKATFVEVLLVENCSNSFEIQLFDGDAMHLKCTPSQFNIIQGGGKISPVLPYHIGIGKQFEDKGDVGFFPVAGLEKNKSLPAKGVTAGLRTTDKISPRTKDKITIGVYQGEYSAEGTDLELNNLIYEVVITGEKLPEELPVNSPVDISIKVDESQNMLFEARFPSINYEEKIELKIKQTDPPSKQELLKKISEARQTVRKINATGEIPASDRQLATKAGEELSGLEDRLSAGEDSVNRRLEILSNLRKLLLELYPVRMSLMYLDKEKEMMAAYSDMELLINKIKNDRIDKKPGYEAKFLYDAEAFCLDFHQKKEQVRAEKNIGKAEELTGQLKGKHLILEMTPTGGIKYLMYCSTQFDTVRWNNPQEREMAKNLLAQALMAVNNTLPGHIPQTMDYVLALLRWFFPSGPTSGRLH